jgi:hypothetical protein
VSVTASNIEVITRVTPLGIRFRDQATGHGVRDGLSVQVGGVDGIPNPTDVFVFSGLPGLRASEQGGGEPGFWLSPPVTGSYGAQVLDLLGRYQPFSFELDAPYRGLFELPCALESPPESPLTSPPSSPPASRPTSPPELEAPAVPLFSAPARPAVPGMAAVRAEIHESATGDPAAFAVLEVDAGAGGPRGRGFTDDQGRALVILPYPRPPNGLGIAPRSIEAAAWTLNVRVRYARGAATGPFPDICSVLGQPTAVALSTRMPQAPLSTGQLAFGQDLVLATAGENVLLVT